jgi:hypothetical protein
MRWLTAFWREWRIFILGWALREIDPTHPDLPKIVIERTLRLEARKAAPV